VRYALRATPIKPTDTWAGLEASREVDTDLVRDKLANGQAIPTPEATYEDLWAQLRNDLDLRYA
jgi:hypothetical protein